MFQDPVVVKPPPDDQMEVLASSSGKPSTNDVSRRSRSGSVNQDPQQALKCPRCDSSNTKFCYFNNYSLTQPRHFCKHCRRYWTNGGALRNVPVGGGCRKNKRVKQRLLGGVDPCTSLEESTSNMLARLSNNYPSFGGGGPGSFAGDESGQLLNIAFSRFQEAMRLRQQQSSENPAGTQPDDFHGSFFDMGFPSLMNKTCASGACGGACTCGGALNAGLMGTSENNLNISMGYNTLPVKLEHDGISYNPTNYELNTFFDQTRHLHMSGTSATATLASIADQLSNFSNVSVNPDANLPQLKAQEQKTIPLQQQQLAEQKVPLQLLNHGGSHHSSNQGGHTITDFSNHAEPEQKVQVIMEGKPLINVNGLSLMPPDNWEQSPLMNDMFFEPHHNLWNHSRWQDMHALASTTAAGRVL